MQKACNPKQPGNRGHNEKAKPKDYRLLQMRVKIYKGSANIFNKIMEENFPNLQKAMPMTIQKPYRTPNRLDQKRNTSSHIIIKTPNVLNKERILKAVREKGQVTYKGRPIRITPDFSPETMKAR